MLALSQVLLESRKSDFIKKYTEKFDNQQLFDIIQTSNSLSKSNKYLFFLGKILYTDNFTNDLKTAKHYIELFDKNSNELKIDINTIKSLQELKSVINKHFNRDRRTYKIRKDAKVIYEDDKYLVLIPLSAKASCYYGSGTKWCTAMKDDSSYYTDKKADGELFYILNKKDPSSKPEYKIGVEYIELLNRYIYFNAKNEELDKDRIYKPVVNAIEEYVSENFEINPIDNPKIYALSLHLDITDIEEIEDIVGIGNYYALELYKYGSMTYAVGNENEARDTAIKTHKEYLQQLEDETLLNNYSNYLNNSSLEDLAESIFRDMVETSPENYLTDEDKILSDNQNGEIESYVDDIKQFNEVRVGILQKLEELNVKLVTWEERLKKLENQLLKTNNTDIEQRIEDLIERVEEEIEFYENKINDLEVHVSDLEDDIETCKEEIESIKEEPDGGYDEDKIEIEIQREIDYAMDNLERFIVEYNINVRDYFNFDVAAEGEVDGFGATFAEFIGTYDGEEDEYDVDGKTYYIFRIN